MRNKIKFVFILTFTILFLSACSNIKVTFLDYDDSIIAKVKVDKEGNVELPEEPNRVGYTFTGWDSELSNILVDTAVKAVYTANEYNITFANTDEQSVKAKYDSVVEEAPVPKKPGYTFICWTLDGVDISFPLTFKYTTDIVLQPKFVQNTLTFEVSFYSENGDLLKKENVIEGMSATPPVMSDKTGYQFVGWDKDISEITSKVITTAIYEPFEFTINFEYDGMTPMIVKYDEEIELPIIEKENYVFDGWLLDGNFVEDIFVYNLLKDISLKPSLRYDYYDEVLEFLININTWVMDADSFQVSNQLTIKKSKYSSDYLIKSEDISTFYPDYNYMENMILDNDRLTSYQILREEAGGLLYLYDITPRSEYDKILYTKEYFGTKEEVGYVDYDPLFSEGFTREMFYEKKSFNYYSITARLGQIDIFEEIVDIDIYKDVLIKFDFMFNSARNTLKIIMNFFIEFNYEYVIFYNNYNSVQIIDPNTNSNYELKAANNFEDAEVIEVNQQITKTQMPYNGHYYKVHLEAGQYLFDFDPLSIQYTDNYELMIYDMNYVQVDTGILSKYFSLSLDFDRTIFVEEGDYYFKITDKFCTGYKFTIKKLDYTTTIDFDNPTILTENISGNIEGIFDGDVYSIELIGEDNKIIYLNNISPNMALLCIDGKGNGNAFVSPDDTSVAFELREGTNKIIIIGSSELDYNINISYSIE